jgi:hypothetical protein
MNKITLQIKGKLFFIESPNVHGFLNSVASPLPLSASPLSPEAKCEFAKFPVDREGGGLTLICEKYPWPSHYHVFSP